jgi:hypothetical protein
VPDWKRKLIEQKEAKMLKENPGLAKALESKRLAEEK